MPEGTMGMEGISIGFSRKQVVYALMVLSLLVAGAAAWLGITLYKYAHRPASEKDTQVSVAIAAGESFDRLAQKLRHEGVIRETTRFKLLARLRGDDKRLKAGEYRLTVDMTPIQVLDVLVRGDVFLHVLTIPEGFTVVQIAQELQKLKLASEKAFVEAATDPAVVAAFGLEGDTLEGYLFPDTYYFPKGLPEKVIISKMVDRFKEQVPRKWYDRANDLGFTMLQIVTLASIIEKETGDPSERPIISSVFHNRLKKRMRLESDPTVIYGIEDFDGNIKRRHLTTYTPYNTYKIKGLPPGPIANPGRASIEAALYPAQTDYLYFVSKRDGTHYFSTTIREHNKAVRKYQLRRRSKPSS